jgi:hypothetical protein
MGRELVPLSRLEAHNQRSPSRGELVRLIRELHALCDPEPDVHAIEAYRVCAFNDAHATHSVDLLL